MQKMPPLNDHPDTYNKDTNLYFGESSHTSNLCVGVCCYALASLCIAGLSKEPLFADAICTKIS